MTANSETFLPSRRTQLGEVLAPVLTAHNGGGFWNTVLAITLGVGIGSAFFGDDDE